MAEMYHNREGRDLWRPTRITLRGRKLLLDPALSPMENLSKVIDAQVSIWLAKYLVYSDSREMVEQLEQDCKMAVFVELRRRVRLGTYDRKFSLYLNIRSCAWSVISRTVTVWMRDVNRQANECSIYMEVGEVDKNKDLMVDTISSEKVPKLVTESERNSISHAKRTAQRRAAREAETDPVRKAWRTRLSEYNCSRWAAQRRKDAYEDYVIECLCFGLTPIPEDEFIRKNFPEDE